MYRVVVETELLATDIVDEFEDEVEALEHFQVQCETVWSCPTAAGSVTVWNDSNLEQFEAPREVAFFRFDPAAR